MVVSQTAICDGLLELGSSDMIIECVAFGSRGLESGSTSTALVWTDCIPPGSFLSDSRPSVPLKATGKRRRLPLNLAVENLASDNAEVVVSLSAHAEPANIRSGTLFAPGVLHRNNLPEGVTPNLPERLGPAVSFVTLSASIPPRSIAYLCSAAPTADRAPGFVYKLSTGGPHVSPDAWDGLTLGFPLDCSAIRSNCVDGVGEGSVLCTQGFGGKGHHRGSAAHHSADFDCPVGTPLLAVFAGTVTDINDGCSVGGPHVDLLPEAGFLRLDSADGAVSAVYLHLAKGSSRVRVGERVVMGQTLASSGDTGFSHGPHLHLHIERRGCEPSTIPKCSLGSVACAVTTAPLASAACSEHGDGNPTVMWALHDASYGAVVPVAGHWYGKTGWVPPVEALEVLREAIGLTPGRRIPVMENLSLARALEIASAGLLWCRAEPIRGPDTDPDSATHSVLPAVASVPFMSHGDTSTAANLDVEDSSLELRAFPSLHTCLVANVLVVSSLLLEGAKSRFVRRRAFPPVYLACTFNFDRDE